MHVHQVASEGCGLHHLSTLDTLDIPGVPLSRSDMATSQTPVQISRELGPYPTRGADHRLHLGRICLKPKPSRKDSQEDPVRSAGVPRPLMQGTRCRHRRLQKRLTSIRPILIPRSLLLPAAPGTTRVQQY